MSSIEYQFYLASPQWRRKRERIMRRDCWECQFCHSEANHVHHITYRNWPHEDDDDLIALCRDCHQRVHDEEWDELTQRAMFAGSQLTLDFDDDEIAWQWSS